MAKAKATAVASKKSYGTCYSVMYFTDEGDADTFAKIVRTRGDVCNGGWYSGVACGRWEEFDHTDQDGVQWYAVTTA
jgi:hypothetical protein